MGWSGTGMLAEPETLAKELEAQKARARDLDARRRTTTDTTAADRVETLLNETRGQGVVDEIERLVDASRGGEADAGKTADERLKELAAKLDMAEGLLEWPELVTNARRAYEQTDQEVSRYGNPQDRAELEELETRMNAAIRDQNPESLRAVLTDLQQLGGRAMARDPSMWIQALQEMASFPPGSYSDPSVAQRLIRVGMEAVMRKDGDGVQANQDS